MLGVVHRKCAPALGWTVWSPSDWPPSSFPAPHVAQGVARGVLEVDVHLTRRRRVELEPVLIGVVLNASLVELPADERSGGLPLAIVRLIRPIGESDRSGGSEGNDRGNGGTAAAFSIWLACSRARSPWAWQRPSVFNDWLNRSLRSFVIPPKSLGSGPARTGWSSRLHPRTLGRRSRLLNTGHMASCFES